MKLVHLVAFITNKSRNIVCLRYIIVNTRYKDDDDDDNNNNNNEIPCNVSMWKYIGKIHHLLT